MMTDETKVPGLVLRWTPFEEPGREALGTCTGDRFVLRKPLGQGGNAVVWQARDRLMGRFVAIKILRSRDPDLQRRFDAEAEILANIDHPNIVRACARGVTTEGQPFLALELVRGQSLDARLEAAGPLPWREVIEIGIQVADALAALHARGVIHRDVKPANLMLVEGDAARRVVKLIDFGVARLSGTLGEPEAEDSNPKPPRRPTDVGVAIGTSGYMPLEAGLGPADERFDVYSLGVTLHELCTGTRPGIEAVRPLGEVYPACDAPADLTTVLAAALALEPGDRTQTAAELGRALAAVRAAHPEHTTSPLVDDRYERICLLGTGAKGDVFLANHRGGGHDVALKFLRSTQPDDLRRFEREARLLAALDHPGLPRFYDYAPDADPPYIAMGRAQGVLAVTLCRQGDANRLRPLEVTEVGLQLAQILVVLHERGIVHRDINANNVIIDLQRRPVVALVDLGCADLTEGYYSNEAAKRRYRTPPEARVKIPDGGIEKLAWSAPETRAGLGWTDKSDVYSLGLLLFRLLTGKVPMKKAGDPPMSVRELARVCPEELASAIVCALNPDPGERATAAELVLRLQGVLEEDAALREDAVRSATDDPVLAPTPPEGAEWDRAPGGPTPLLPSAAPARRWGVVGAGIMGVGVIALLMLAVAGGRSSLSTAEITAAIAPDRGPSRPTTRVEAPPARILVGVDTALTSVGPQLQRCAALAGEAVPVELTVRTGLDHFAGIDVLTDDRRIVQCFRGVLDPLRFSPSKDQTLTQDYAP